MAKEKSSDERYPMRTVLTSPSPAGEALLLGIETGGTKIVCAAVAASDPTRTVSRRTIVTRAPSEVLVDIAEFVGCLPGTVIGAGVAAFGPLDLDLGSQTYGHVGSTPKAGWDGVDLLGTLQTLLPGVPFAITTDVAAAALAEAAHGLRPGIRNLTYATVGTGIGVGVLRAGELQVGTGWPEIAHIPVQRHPADVFPGVCRFHADCLEGLASGPAISARAEMSRGAAGDSDRHRAEAITAYYLAQLVATLYFCLGSELVILGGGVMKTPGLLQAVRVHALRRVGPPGSRGSSRTLTIETTVLDGEAGLVGAMMLAGSAERRGTGGR